LANRRISAGIPRPQEFKWRSTSMRFMRIRVVVREHYIDQLLELAWCDWVLGGFLECALPVFLGGGLEASRQSPKTSIFERLIETLDKRSSNRGRSTPHVEGGAHSSRQPIPHDPRRICPGVIDVN